MSRGLGDVYKRQGAEQATRIAHKAPVSYTHLTLPTTERV
ncbi:hypothetical protein JMUB7531_29250 [Staphylococcus aureus]